MSLGFPGFPPEALRFLRGLKRNNNREWFLKHKAVYEEKVRTPMNDLVLALSLPMQSFAPEMVVDPKRAIYRIYRDVRFSADKSPYKTHVAAIFVPRGMPKNSSAAFYFHVAPDEVLIAGGLYMPGPAELRAIRQRIAERHEELRRILRAREFRRRFGGLEGEQLTRPPKGFAPDHPAADLLRHRQWLAFASEPPALAESPEFFPSLLACFRSLTPLVRFLNEPLK